MILTGNSTPDSAKSTGPSWSLASQDGISGTINRVYTGDPFGITRAEHGHAPQPAMTGTEREHRYEVHLAWTGGQQGSSPFRNHSRDYLLISGTKPPISGSADPVFRGNPARWNPEELLVASLAACHQLWYLGLCAAAGIVVVAYEDDAEGVMRETSPGGAGAFTEVVLRPRVVLAPASDLATAEALHHQAHERCFIARSVNFPVTLVPQTVIGPAPA